LTRLLTGSDQLSFYPAWGGWLSLIGFAAIAYVLIRIPTPGYCTVALTAVTCPADWSGVTETPLRPRRPTDVE